MMIIKNDTTINIIKSEWKNDRGLLTMKLEGEDIYLTIFMNSGICLNKPVHLKNQKLKLFYFP
jgi:hypothetical protein